MSYTDEELEGLLASGDAQENEDGSVTWAANNIYDKKPGTWLVRPPQAAPLITTDTGADLARIRQENRQLALAEGFAVGIGESIDQILTSDEALSAMMARFAEQGMNVKRKDYQRIVKTLFDVLGMTQHKTKVEIDQREQKIEISASEIKILSNSPAVQRLLDKKDD